MTGLFRLEGDGHTVLSDEDRDGLIPSYIATRGDLFDAEERNIVRGLLRLGPPVRVLLDDLYLRDLHRAMFGGVWEWAGRYRRRETNIGIDPTGIAPAVRLLVGRCLHLGRTRNIRTRRNLCAFPPSACLYTPVPQRERPAQPNLRRLSRRRLGDGTIQLG